MKKNIILTAALAAAMSMTACHDEGKEAIPFSQLPETAQAFVTTHFADKQVAIIYLDREVADSEYEVTFSDGASADFSKKGE